MGGWKADCHLQSGGYNIRYIMRIMSIYAYSMYNVWYIVHPDCHDYR